LNREPVLPVPISVRSPDRFLHRCRVYL